MSLKFRTAMTQRFPLPGEHETTGPAALGPGAATRLRAAYHFHGRRFVADVARWIEPEMVGDPALVTPLTTAKLLYRHPALRAVAWFRFASFARDLGVPGVRGLVQRRLLRLYGLELAPGTDIDGGLYIAHPSGTVIAVERIGRNVSIIASVTLGTRGDGRWPRIADDVFIGSGARVLGGIEVGSRAVIGANAVVLSSVEPGATVVGVPARRSAKGPDGGLGE